MIRTSETSPSALVSYSWDSEEHKEWVRELAERLRQDGVEVTLDQWHAVPGDQLTEFMEREVRENDYVLIVCTPRYKQRSDERVGGVGYEGDIITGEALTVRNQRKFIPILREGTWAEAAPTWLAGKYYVDLSNSPFSEEQYNDLLITMLGTRPEAPPVGPVLAESRAEGPRRTTPAIDDGVEEEPIKITGVVVDEVGVPRGDGTPGSALYRVPFRLSRRPPHGWGRVLVKAWDLPSEFTSMHRPGIASVVGDQILLDGTTLEEVERYHRKTLVLAVKQANEEYGKSEEMRRNREAAERKRVEDHRADVRESAERIKFDE